MAASYAIFQILELPKFVEIHLVLKISKYTCGLGKQYAEGSKTIVEEYSLVVCFATQRISTYLMRVIFV